MACYMPKVGKLGLDMMFRTATVQVNLDFGSEADMVKKLRVGLALQPIATAIFANSPFTEGKPNRFQSYRAEIWCAGVGQRCRCRSGAGRCRLPRHTQDRRRDHRARGSDQERQRDHPCRDIH